MLTLRQFAPAGAIISFLVLAACGDSSKETASAFESEQGILRFVPADTPYLIATPGDFPDDVVDKIEPQIDATLQAYQQILRAIVDSSAEQAPAEGEDPDSIEQSLPVIDELGSLLSVEGLREAGIDRESDLAIYGVGLLPVLRLSLSDGELFEAAIARMETQAGTAMDVASVGNQAYRYAGDDKGRLIIAVIDNDLVVAIVPTDLPDDLLQSVLGIVLPEHNIASTGALAEIAKTHGFEDYMIGMLDIERITATFLEEPSGIDAELLTMMEYERSELSDVCLAEIREMAGTMPRMVMGYTSMSVAKISSKAVLELREDLAAGVASITGTVPGMTADLDGLFSFGMSIDLLAARSFYEARLDALEADPYECALFAELQAGVANGRDILNQPVPPIVYGLKGFLAVVENFESSSVTGNPTPESVDMRMLLATDNAEGLLAMGAMFSPDIAALAIEPDGEPVRLTVPQMMGTDEVLHIAMTDTALGLSVGEGMEAGLASMLNAAVPERSPFMVFEMDAARYYEFINDAILADQGGTGAMPELQEAIGDITRIAQNALKRVSFDIYFTEHGIEMESEIILAD